MTTLKTGKITGITIGEYPGGTDTVRVLQVELISSDDVVKVEHFSESGEDSAPVVGDKVLVEFIGDSPKKVSQTTKDNITPVSTEGEKELYSHDGTLKKSRVKLKLDGSLGIKNQISGKDFVTEMTEYNTAVKAIVTSDGATINTASQTALDVALAKVFAIVGGI